MIIVTKKRTRMQVENLEFDHSGKFIHPIGQFKLCCVPCWTNHLRTRVEATPSETPEGRRRSSTISTISYQTIHLHCMYGCNVRSLGCGAETVWIPRVHKNRQLEQECVTPIEVHSK